MRPSPAEAPPARPRLAPGITTKLLIANLVVFAVVGAVIAVASGSFRRIEELLATTVVRGVNAGVENAALLKDLSGVLSEANLVASTFLRDEEGLASRGRWLATSTAALQRRATNEALRGALGDLSAELGRLVEACARVNRGLRDVEREEEKLTALLGRLERLVSEAAVNQILAGEDAVIMEQVSALVSGYRETFLQVHLLFLRATSAGPAHRAAHPAAALTPLVDDLALRFRTLTASGPQIAAYAPRLVATLDAYRAAVMRSYEALRMVDDRLAAAERAKAVVVSQAAQLEDGIAASTLSARRNISAVMREAAMSMAAGSAGILALLVGVTLVFIELNLRRPMATVRAGIEAIRRGDLGARIALRRHDEWAHVEGALNRLAADLAASYGELREKNRVLEATQRELHGKMAEVVAEAEARKRLEEQLRQAQKMEAVGTLAGGVAHDFNNILSVVTGCASILRRELGRDPSLLSCVEDILTVSERATVLTRDLLAFGRKQVMRLEPIAVGEIVRQVEKLLGRVIGENIELDVHVDDGELTVLADRVQLEQVLLNLAANARDAMPDGGRLTIRAARVELGADVPHGLAPGPHVAITVVDSGAGMDAATRARIFEPFFTTKVIGKGTGLGLSMAYGIVKQHRGEIEVESAPGEGTRFRILFPLVDGTPARPVAPAPLPAPRRGTETILVAEDDPAVRRLIARVLTQFGYAVVEAVDGEDAVRKFAENADRVRLAILDLVMPRKDGRQAGDEIRRARPGVPVLFSSGYTADLVTERDVLEEGLHFLPKPVAPEVLLAKVRELLG